MMQQNNHTLSKTNKTKLRSYQSDIDNEIDFSDKVEKAKSKWKGKNLQTFSIIKNTLKRINPCGEYCAYCETSLADEIEHIYPKTLFSEKTFLWDNYLWVCGICNRTHKSNKFAIYNPHFQDITPFNTRSNPIQPVNDHHVFIHQRLENPLDFITLDFNTGLLCPSFPSNTKEYDRTDYTLNTVLNLNRDVLCNARKNAYRFYKGCLQDYLSATTKSQKRQIEKEIEKADHKTVWEEMKIQHIWVNELNDLFSQSPHLLTFP
ncbi:MAG: hypothetical protein ACKVTZ_01105 [Bacteroidia bacterium]